MTQVLSRSVRAAPKPAWTNASMERPGDDLPFTVASIALDAQGERCASGQLFAHGGETRLMVSPHADGPQPMRDMLLAVLKSGWAFWLQDADTADTAIRLRIALREGGGGVRQLRALGYQQIVVLGEAGRAGGPLHAGAALDASTRLPVSPHPGPCRPVPWTGSGGRYTALCDPPCR